MDDILKIDLCYLANTLTNIDDMLKIVLFHLTSTLTKTDDETDNFTRRKLVIFNQLFILCHRVTIEDNNFIPQ